MKESGRRRMEKETEDKEEKKEEGTKPPQQFHLETIKEMTLETSSIL